MDEQFNIKVNEIMQMIKNHEPEHIVSEEIVNTIKKAFDDGYSCGTSDARHEYETEARDR